MADIKTRDVDRSMKFKDAAAGLPKELVRDLALKTGDAFRSGSSASGFEPESMSEDAGNRMEKGMEWTADHGTRSVWSAGKKAAGTAARKWKDRDQADSLETETSSAGKTYAEGQENRPSPAEKRESLKKQESSAEPSPENGKDPRTLKTRERIEDGKKELERSGRTLKDTGKELKTAGKAARRTGYANGAVQEAAIAKEQSKRAYQAGKQLAMQGKQAVKTGAKGAKKVFQGAKTAVRTAVTAVRSVIGLVSAGAVVIFLVIILGVVGGIAGASGSSSSEALSQEVLAYTATIQRYASEFGIPEYVASIQAIMMQESGGRGTDPMQASECPYNTEYPNTPGGITDPDYSIRVGIQYYADCVTQAGCESPADISRLQLSWQGYNYGNGYIGWALTNYGGYSLENALEFSQQQAAAHGWSGYGDPEYVPHVQRYYSGGNLFAGLFGNQQIVTIAKGEIGASDGQKYWSWYGFSSYQEWCACFVSWCGEQAGLIESGAMPRFSLCSDGMSWFQSQGKWQAAGSTPTAGSLVFFDWGGDGVPDHVAIVEKCENGIVYTVEGNTSTRVNGESVRGVWQHQYPVSDQSILGYGTI